MAACRGKTALVTNATHAPCRTAALALAEAGAKVLLHEQRPSRDVAALVEHLRNAGAIAKAIAVDTSSTAGLQHLAQQARAIVGDRLDVLVLDGAAAPSLVQLLLPILCTGSSVVFLYPAGKAVGDEMTQLAALLRLRGARANALEVSRAASALKSAIVHLASNESIGLTGATLRSNLRSGRAGRRAAASAARGEGAR